MPQSWKPKRLEPCDILVELASSGRSVKVTPEDGEPFYIGLLDIDALRCGKRVAVKALRLVEVSDPEVPGDPHGPLTPEIKQKIRHEVAELNRSG